MATKNFKPGGGKFASGNKFKGRASAGDDSNNTRPPRDARNFNADRSPEGAGGRPEKAGKFGGESKKVFNRSERFTRPGEEGGPRAGGDRSRSFDRSTFKSGPKFGKSAPYQGDRRTGDDNQNSGRPSFNRDQPSFNRDQAGRSDRQERPERSDRSGHQDDKPGGDRPRYGERRQAEGGYAARGERRPAPAGDRKPYGTKPYQKSFGAEGRREDKPAYGKSRFDKGDQPRFDKPREGAGYRSRETGEGAEPRAFNRPRPEGFDRNRPGKDRGGDHKAFDRPKPADDRGGDHKTFGRPKAANDRGAGKEERERRPFRSKSEEPGEAPNYDLKRYQAREHRKPEKKEENGLIRLNRYIANAGICSRREADTLIASGEIKVNGEVITEMGYTVRPEDTVTYGKKRLNREKMVYVLLNKPKDFITTTEDPEGRKTVMDLVGKASKERIFPVGRLDRNTTGLLLFTNDGELAHKLTHPSNNVSKIYQVELDKPITREHFEIIVNGLELEDGKAEVDDLAIIGDSNTFLGIQIHIGKNRIVRRIFEHLGYEVVSLDRVQYAGLTKKDLSRGNWRFLNEKEVIRLKYFL